MPRISLSVIKTQFVTASRGAADRSVLSLPTIFSTCRPRADVLAGSVRDDEFMADLSRVVNSTPPADYLDPTAFFAKRYPTRGMKELLKGKMARRTRGVK